MGYTHFWKQRRALSENEFNQVRDIALRVHGHTAVILRDGAGEGDGPIFEKAFIAFNGDAATGDDHETFYLSPESTEFSFCKTAFKPYDEAVVACLILVSELLPDAFEWSSDGNIEEHAAGIALADKARL